MLATHFDIQSDFAFMFILINSKITMSFLSIFRASW